MIEGDRCQSTVNPAPAGGSYELPVAWRDERTPLRLSGRSGPHQSGLDALSNPFSVACESTDSAASGPAAKSTQPWLPAWLACLAFYYPALWLSTSLVWAIPALVRAAFSGYRLESFRLLPIGAIASSVPAIETDHIYRRSLGNDFSSLGILLVVMLVVLAVLVMVRKWIRPLDGFGAAMLGNVALVSWLARLPPLRQARPQSLIVLPIFFAVLCLGLRRMLAGWGRQRYLKRVGTLFVNFVLLPVLPWAWFALFRHLDFRSFAPLFMLPSAIAALAVGIRPLNTKSSERLRIGWKAVACGAAASVLLAVAVRQGQAAIERARVARNRAAMAALPEIPHDLPYPKLFFQKGVNFTAEFPATYDSEGARHVLEQLPAYGVNAIALVPYGWSSPDSPHVRLATGRDSWENDDGLRQLSRLAHHLGIKVMLKPAIWVRAGNAGDLQFPGAAERAEWFSEYGRFLEHYARLAREIHADILCIGGELSKLTPYDADWRRLIARARELYPGPLVYAANWGPEFENLNFWDALDYIGLQEYYPLPDDLSTDALLQKVAAVHRKFNRPVIFTEAGFPSYEKANREPWDDSKPYKLSLEDQARCYTALLRTFYRQPWFEGVYWWSVGTNGAGGPQDRSFTPWGKPAMDVIKWYYCSR